MIPREKVEELLKAWQFRSDRCKRMSEAAFELGEMKLRDEHLAWHACCERIVEDLKALFDE